jgi:hypothetical protein
MESVIRGLLLLAPFTSFSVTLMFSRFILFWHVSVLHVFLWLNTIPFYGFITFCVHINQLMDIWIDPVVWLLGMMLMQWFMLTFLCEHMLLILLTIYLGVELLGHMETIYLTFWGTARLFFTADAQFLISTNTVKGFQFLHILVNTCYLGYFYYSHTSGCEMISHCGFDLHFPSDWQ